MVLEERIPLAHLTTFKVGGPAHVVAHATTVEEVKEAIGVAQERALPFYVLGEGSNVLASDDGYDGVIIRVEIPGIAISEDGTVTVGAGVSWDALVTAVTAHGLWGMENLAGIPGTVGAAPVQNIGAYGAELAQVLHSVTAVDARTNTVVTLSREECAFGYRDSRFKHEPELIITSVRFALTKEGTPKIEYSDLLKAQEAGTDLSTPTAIAAAVRMIRAGKFPDLSVYGTAGSFFKNPILTEEKYAELVARYGEIPRFPAQGGIKIPLAFVLDKALSLRGYRHGAAWLFGAQPLVLTLDAGGTAAAIETLARDVETKVHDATGITIEREVRSLPTK